MRSPIKYYGGKGEPGTIAWLRDKVPYQKIYVEPFCGGASLFFARRPSPVEVLNDINQDVVNLFRVLQQPELFEKLKRRLQYTPYAKEEFRLALETRSSDDPVERAWSFFVRQNQGTGSIAKTVGNWGRAFVSTGGMAMPVNAWLTKLDLLDQFATRLQHVQIDCQDAVEAIGYWDKPETVFYCDPPYVAETRAKGHRDNVYDHEYTDEEHSALIDTLLACKGIVCLSGYDHPLYAALDQAGWRRHERPTACYAASRNRDSGLQGVGSALEKVPRTEILWVNRCAQRMLF